MTTFSIGYEKHSTEHRSSAEGVGRHYGYRVRGYGAGEGLAAERKRMGTPWRRACHRQRLEKA